MYQIMEKRRLNPQVTHLVVKAPLIAKKAQPGQFIILRIDEKGERIPLTIADYNKESGTVTIVFQEVGATTMLLGSLNEGDFILDFVGPLGKPSDLEHFRRVCVVGGGLGCAIAYPQAKKLHELGAHVDIVAGFRNKELIFFEEEMGSVSDSLFLCTDDGSNGNKGLVTDQLKKLLDAGTQYDMVIAFGPLIMMKFVCLTTKPYGVKTIVSMNPIMIDGTGMCGGCRLTIDGQQKFACVDGPDFDGHLVDFDEAIRRSGVYKVQEQESVKRVNCRLPGMGGI